MTEADWDRVLLEFDQAVRDDELDPELAAYRVGEGGRLFAVVEKSSRPLRLSFRCDRLLARTLRDRYETVLAASKLDPRTWNTYIATGQLPDDELIDLARLSYNLSAE